VVIFAKLFAQVEKFKAFKLLQKSLQLAFVAQEREVTLTWSIAEIYIGHFFCKGRQCSGTFFQQKNTLILQNLSFG
jgi:hypothetical protein